MSAGDESAADYAARELAGAAALTVTFSRKGSENRETVARFQRANGLPARGLYDAPTMLKLIGFGIVPPVRFEGGGEPYWPVNAAPAKTKIRQVLTHMANTDEPRRDEWRWALAHL